MAVLSVLALGVAAALPAPFAGAQPAANPGAGAGPNAEYTAEFKVQGYGPTQRGRVYGAPGKERRETPGPWGGSTLILRYDLGLAWSIIPQRPFYSEFPLRPPGSPAPPPGAVPPGLSRIEDDDINDIPATKYAFPPGPGGAGGYIWLSHEGIALRIDGAPQPGGPEIRFELDNVKFGAQDPGLFELPPGYQKLGPPPPPPPSAGDAPPAPPRPGAAPPPS